MAKYQLTYTEVKKKGFNKLKNLRDFAYTKTNEVLDVTEKKDGVYHRLDFKRRNW